MLYSFNVFSSSSSKGWSQVTEHRALLRAPTPLHCQLTIDPGWDKPDLDTSAGSDETLHSALESLGKTVWAKGFFLILVFICWVTEVKLSLFDYLKLLAVEIICALAAVRWVVCSSESVAVSKEVILHSTSKLKIGHIGQKALHGTMQKLLSARRNPLIFWRRESVQPCSSELSHLPLQHP